MKVTVENDPQLPSSAEVADTLTEDGRGVESRLEKLFRVALFIIPIGVVGNVAFSLIVTDRELLASITDFPRGYLALAMVLGIIPWFTNALRLLIWTRFLGHELSFPDTFRITLATDLGSAVSPAAVGGGFFKWGLLVQRGVSPGGAASLTTLAPLEDGLFFAIALPLAIVLTTSWGNPVFGSVADQIGMNALPLAIAAASIALLTWAVSRWILEGRLGRSFQLRGLRWITRIRRSFRTTWIDARQVYRLIRQDGKLLFALSMLLTSIQWIARYSIISALIAFLGAPVQPVLFWLLQWVVFTLAAFVPTPGSAGGAEAAFFVVYAPFVPAPILPIAMAGWRFFTFYLILALAAILYIALGGMHRKRS